MDGQACKNTNFKLEINSIEKSNFINDQIKEKEINEYDIEKSDIINKMNLMNSMMDQMDMNQKNTMMMMNQMCMNNQMDSMMMNYQMDINQLSPMGNMANMMNNQMRLEDEKINDKNNGGINILFRIEGHSSQGDIIPHLLIQCLTDEKVSDVIQRYRVKSLDKEPTKKFIYNSKNLNPDLTVAEAGLTNHCPMMFTDISKNKTKEIGFSKKAPSYRKVTKGINIFGICIFKKCKAYKKEVVVRIKKKKLDLIKERDELFCPECEAIIIPKTVGFYLCKFKIYGKKIEDDIIEPFKNDPDEANNKDSLKYFDPEFNGEVKVSELIFEVLEYL